MVTLYTFKKHEVRGQSACIYIRRGPIVAQFVITLGHSRERHRDHNRVLSQESASVRDDRIGRYPNVSARPDREDRVTSRPDRRLNLDNHTGTYYDRI